MRNAFDEGFRCNQEYDILSDNVLFGMVRVTFGAMNTMEDVEQLARCIRDRLVDHDCDAGNVSMPLKEKSEASRGNQMTIVAEAMDSARGQPSFRGGWIKRFLSVVFPCLP
jgi:molybdenum cofactor sulfurtransferase